MKFISIIFSVFFLLGGFANVYSAHAITKGDNEKQQVVAEHKHHHRLIEPEKVEELKEKGYSKQEIFMGAILGKKSGKEIDEVLKLYKDEGSWDKAASKLGIDMEEFKRIEAMHHWEKIIRNHEDEVIAYLAEYNDTKEKNIRKLLDDKTSLRFLVGASVMAKLSDKDLEDIVKMKKKDKAFHEILDELDIDEEELHKELYELKLNMKNRLKEKLDEEKEVNEEE